jgi:hypothetical protein
VAADIDKLIASFEAAAAGTPDFAFKLVGLAETVALAKAPVRAAEIARRALAGAPDDAAVRMRARRLLGALLPGYHVPMMNDVRRNAAWDAALRAAIRPGMLVFEIGTGAGMLALMAARAGAEVVTCEINHVAAAMARELAARNGLADRIEVIDGNSRDVRVGEGLPRRADLLVCDIFGDELLDFDPLPLIADARQRLLAPGAPSVPRAVGLQVALARWEDWQRTGHIGQAAGFDLSSFADFVPAAVRRPVDVAGLHLLSDGAEALRFDLAALPRASVERSRFTIAAREDGAADTLARWIRLELDAETMLEARPEPGGIFFSGLTLAPLEAEVHVAAGQIVQAGALRNARAIDTWLEG